MQSDHYYGRETISEVGSNCIPVNELYSILPLRLSHRSCSDDLQVAIHQVSNPKIRCPHSCMSLPICCLDAPYHVHIQAHLKLHSAMVHSIFNCTSWEINNKTARLCCSLSFSPGSGILKLIGIQPVTTLQNGVFRNR